MVFIATMQNDYLNSHMIRRLYIDSTLELEGVYIVRAQDDVEMDHSLVACKSFADAQSWLNSLVTNLNENDDGVY